MTLEKINYEAKLPVLRYSYENGISVCEWVNFNKLSFYEKAMPCEVRELVVPEGPQKLLLVCDQQNVAMNAAFLLQNKQNSKVRCRMEEEGLPLEKNVDNTRRGVSLVMLDLADEKPVGFQEKWDELYSKASLIQGFFVSGMFGDRKLYKFEELRLFLEETGGNTYIHIRKEDLQRSEIQRFITEGGYTPVWLETVNSEHYIDLAQELFIAPAMTKMILKYPGLNQPNMEELFLEENPYLLEFDMGELRPAIKKLRAIKGRHFQEMDIVVYLQKVLETHTGFLEFFGLEKKDGFRKLLGFEKLRELCRREIVLEKARKKNPGIAQKQKSFLFIGNPGTGKTAGARIFYEAMAEEGVLTGDFVVAARKDVIGEYIGQTAPKVHDLFDKAANGVLFIDEAGFFLQEGVGGYVFEAVKEFVRYMDSRKDVTVIFALYPGQEKAFLDLDPGLASRIGEIVRLENLDSQTLLEIVENNLQKQGYSMEEGGATLVLRFFDKQRNQLGDSFGNGREAIRLVDAAIVEAEIRKSEKPEDQKTEGNITLADLEKTLDRLEQSNVKPGPPRLGFFVNPKEPKAQAQ